MMMIRRTWFWAGLLAGWMMLAPGMAAGADWQPHADIEAAAVEAVRSRAAGNGGRVDVVADGLDARVRLQRCGGPLKASVPFGDGRRAQRITAEVRCTGPKPWKIYVPVRLTAFVPVVVTSRALPRGTLLAPEDISLAERDIAALGYGYLAAPRDAVGQRLRRALVAGTPITPGMLETPAMVRRGQRLTLEATSGGLSVRMAGIARSDGIRGQVIEVENVNSSRIVQAIVRGPQSAEVMVR